MNARRFADWLVYHLAQGAGVPFWIAGIAVAMFGGAYLIGRLAG